MIKSMTGFGKSVVTVQGRTIVIELRSLNSKQLDMLSRIPALFKEKENEIKTLISKELERGKIDLTITIERNDGAVVQEVVFDKALAKAYYNAFHAFAQELDNQKSDLLAQVLRIPDIIGASKEELDEVTWVALQEGLLDCCRKMNAFRMSEGVHLAADFEQRTRLIRAMVDQITPFEEARIETIRERFAKLLEQYSDTMQYDACRLEQELLFYIEKFDITEEKVRLCKHCQYFLDTMNESQSQGKKLGFIVQEFGREVNTIGSKANDFNIQQLVVRMKDEIEKMKEQLANVL
ncbi:MAG: YicC family protein [Bacteroidales bacterium]|nr:YicC family protein [Bacteroidales bacterium]